MKALYEVFKKLNVHGHIAISKNGWTDNETSLAWFQKCFEPETKNHTQRKYQLLFLDGYDSYVTGKIIDFYVADDIILLCLPANITYHF